MEDINEPQVELVNATPAEVFAWVKELKATEPEQIWAQLQGVITETAPHAEEADKAIILKLEDKIIGGAILRSEPPCLVGAFVRPEYQGRGYGKKLFETAVRQLAEESKKKVLIEACDTRALTIAENLPAELLARVEIKDVRRDD